MALNLENARVIGFFSLPSPSLAETNPTAYNNAMLAAPKLAGTCAHCGTGIRHHVIVEIDSARHFIGSDCALRIGSPAVARCVKAHMTSEEIAAKDAKAEQERAVYAARQAEYETKLNERAAKLADIIDPLEQSQNDFYRSLAAQLKRGSLSEKQANYVCKALIGRLTKKTDQAWTIMFDRITEEE